MSLKGLHYLYEQNTTMRSIDLHLSTLTWVIIASLPWWRCVHRKSKSKCTCRPEKAKHNYNRALFPVYVVVFLMRLLRSSHYSLWGGITQQIVFAMPRLNQSSTKGCNKTLPHALPLSASNKTVLALSPTPIHIYFTATTMTADVLSGVLLLPRFQQLYLVVAPSKFWWI